MPPLFPRIDDEITAPEVSLSSYHWKGRGRMPTVEALEIARDSGLALIEAYPNHEPPGCRLVPRWMVERVKHYFRGPAESLTSDLPPIGVAWLEFDEDGWNSRSVYRFGDRYYNSRGLQPMDRHPVLQAPVLGDQPLWVGNFDQPHIVQVAPDEFEAVWRSADTS